jgi:calcium-dependent protein kinase
LRTQIGCKQRTNDQRVVKIFKKDFTPLWAYEKLKSEIEIIKKIDHPNIIKFYEIFDEPKRVFIVMEHCTGGELFEEILKRQSFSEKEAANIIKNVLLALSYIHSKGIIHRDIKPENILLENKGDVMNIKLINFSTACIIGKNEHKRGLIGTAYYIAPEVISGDYNEKCDVWSAGVLLFMLLSFYPPFEGNSDKEILAKITEQKLEFKEAIWDNVSSEAKDLITKLLSPLETRLSASEALNHQWVCANTGSKAVDATHIVAALENLKSFHNSNKLRDAVQTFITTQCISVNDTKELTEVFKTIDANGDGKLSKEELLEHYIKFMGQGDAEQQVDRIMQELDSDKTGFINYTEFLKASLSEKTIMSSQNLRKAFDLFDRDRSGSISAMEIKKILEGGCISDNKVWTEIVRSFDQNSDGEIDLMEFADIISAKSNFMQ